MWKIFSGHLQQPADSPRFLPCRSRGARFLCQASIIPRKAGCQDGRRERKFGIGRRQGDCKGASKCQQGTGKRQEHDGREQQEEAIRIIISARQCLEEGQDRGRSRGDACREYANGRIMTRLSVDCFTCSGRDGPSQIRCSRQFKVFDVMYHERATFATKTQLASRASSMKGRDWPEVRRDRVQLDYKARR
jgi:hypothetical protein